MHPTELLYYYACAFIVLMASNVGGVVGPLSPLIFRWCFVHLIVSSAASHSGWEDIAGWADQFHYLHHKRFEANYGGGFSFAIDRMMGEYADRIVGDEDEVDGGVVRAGDEGSRFVDSNGSSASVDPPPRKEKGSRKQGRVWSAKAYLQLPRIDVQTLYNFLILLLSILWMGAIAFPARLAAALFPARYLHFSETEREQLLPPLMGVTIASMPVVLCVVLCYLAGERRSWRWPFEKEPMAGSFGLFLALTGVWVAWPVYEFAKMSVAAGFYK